MLQKLIRNGVDVSGKIRALPRYLDVGDYFTGTGSFFMIVKALKKALNIIVPDATQGLQAWFVFNFQQKLKFLTFNFKVLKF